MEYLAAHLSDHENTLNKVEKKKGNVTRANVATHGLDLPSIRSTC